MRVEKREATEPLPPKTAPAYWLIIQFSHALSPELCSNVARYSYTRQKEYITRKISSKRDREQEEDNVSRQTIIPSAAAGWVGTVTRDVSERDVSYY